MLEALKWLLLAAAAVVLAAWALQEKMIFFAPPAGPPPRVHAPGALEEVVLRTPQGYRLHGWLARRGASPGGLVVYFGGNAEETSWMAAESHRLGDWSLLAVNYRGYGASEGTPGEGALYADSLLVYDYARSRPDVDRQRIVLMGRSLGAAVAVHVASQRPVAALVLVTPFDSLVEVGAAHYPFLPVRWLLRHRFDSIALAPRIQAPALVIAAAADTIVPPRHAKRLFEAWGGPRQWVALPGADHNDVDAHEAYWTSIAGFLARLPRAPQPFNPEHS